MENLEKIYEAYKDRKDFRVWLVGNPKELKLERESLSALASFIAYMISVNIPDKETFAGVFVEWFDETLYLIEAYPMGLQFNESYKHFLHEKGWMKKVEAGDVITDFAVPKDGEARRTFNLALNVYLDILQKQQSKREKIMELIRGIERLL